MIGEREREGGVGKNGLEGFRVEREREREGVAYLQVSGGRGEEREDRKKNDYFFSRQKSCVMEN